MTLTIDDTDLIELDKLSTREDDELDDFEIGDWNGRSIFSHKSDHQTKLTRKILALLRKDLQFQELIAQFVREFQSAYLANKEIETLDSVLPNKSWRKEVLPLNLPHSKHKATCLRRKHNALTTHTFHPSKDSLTEEIAQKIQALLEDQEIIERIMNTLASPNGFSGLLGKEIEVLQSAKVAFKTCGFIKSTKKFWKKHKTPILIGLGVAAAVAVVVTVTVCTGGTGTAAAVVASGAALSQIPMDSPPPPEQEKKKETTETSSTSEAKTEPPTQTTPEPSPPPAEAKAEPSAQTSSESPPPPPNYVPPTPPSFVPLPTITLGGVTSNLSSLNAIFAAQPQLITTTQPIGTFHVPFQFSGPAFSPTKYQNNLTNFEERPIVNPIQQTLVGPSQPPLPSWAHQTKNVLHSIEQRVIAHSDIRNPTSPPIKCLNAVSEYASNGLKLFEKTATELPTWLSSPEPDLLPLWSNTVDTLKLIGQDLVEEKRSYIHAPERSMLLPLWKSTLDALRHIGDGIVESPTLSDATKTAQPNSPPSSWLHKALDALKLIGEGIVENPSLFDPKPDVLTKPSWPSEWINHSLEGLKYVGETLVDNPSLFDPKPDVFVQPSWPSEWVNHSLEGLKYAGERLIDNPGLFDPKPDVFTKPTWPAEWVNHSLEGLKYAGERLVDNSSLFDPKPDVFTKPTWPAEWINHSLEGLKYVGERLIDNPGLLDPDDPLYTQPLFSSNQSIQRSMPSHFRIGGINGMNTQEFEKDSHIAYLTNFAPDVSMDWVYNRTHGIFSDLLEIFLLNYPGNSPNTEDLLKKNWTAFYEQNKDNPGAKYLQFCHSQGAIHTKNALKALPPEIRNCIIVVAIAPGAVIPRELCYDSFNYACKNDIVPHGEVCYRFIQDLLTPEQEKGKSAYQYALEDRQQLILLDAPEGSCGMNHSFQHEIYKKIIAHRITEYKTINGNYK